MRSSVRVLGAFLLGVVAAKHVFRGQSVEQTSAHAQITDPGTAGKSTTVKQQAPAAAYEREPRLAWQAVLPLTCLLGATAIWLLPGELERPSLVPVDMGAVESHSRVYLLGLSGDAYSRASLQWSSDSNDDIHFLASIQGPESAGALVFAGPITKAVRNCTINAEAAELQPGSPGAEFASISSREAIDAYSSEDLVHLPLRTALGAASPFILCEVAEGFASNQPPSHWIYTPELVIAIEDLPEGITAANANICVQRTVADDSSDEVCVDATGRAVIGDRLVEFQRPREQWQRDARLTILGLLLGLVAQGCWDLLARVRRLQQA